MMICYFFFNVMQNLSAIIGPKTFISMLIFIEDVGTFLYSFLIEFFIYRVMRLRCKHRICDIVICNFLRYLYFTAKLSNVESYRIKY